VAKRLSSIDFERIRHVSFLMDEYYAQLATIYECLADHELESAKKHIALLIRELKKLSESMEDDI